MPSIRTTIISSALAVGLAGAVVVPGASASKNTGAFARSGAAVKLTHAQYCDQQEGNFNTSVNLGLAASHVGDNAAMLQHLADATASLHNLQGAGCEGF